MIRRLEAGKLNGLDTTGSRTGSSSPLGSTGGSSGGTASLLSLDGSDTMGRISSDDGDDGEGDDDDGRRGEFDSPALKPSAGSDGDGEGCGCDGDVDVLLHFLAPFQ